ncbi:hypothetical protein Ahy_A07g034138 [Arachis hypogaea]|uniref:Uncharacterized protein n=2 Tax=Arachis TaxID=3817 RepID=A0A445CB40_ARAHY|nr:hypothetical protein Ahy_A07g034138 [Arachis hypogaea]
MRVLIVDQFGYPFFWGIPRDVAGDLCRRTVKCCGYYKIRLGGWKEATQSLRTFDNDPKYRSVLVLAGQVVTGETFDVDEEDAEYGEDYEQQHEPGMIVDGIGSFNRIDFSSLTYEEMQRFEFVDLQIAYDFYNEYGRIQGFSIQRSKVGKSTKIGSEGEILWQIFVCSRQGERDAKHIHRVERKMDPRPITRCGCGAQIKMRKAGMRVPTIFRAFATQCGGFETVGFEIKDIYNAIEKQRRVGASDAECALKYLCCLKRNDANMFWKFSLDEERRLHNIFWCDGTSRHDYSVFGDLLGFDATYGRNRYKCPLVIFLGLDHHMRTVVFGCAILSNEVEESYVWFLRVFLEAMKGQEPKSVLTDGDLAMKNAINAVFPNAHHRLCSWRLLRNATARIGQPMFLHKF